MSSFFWFVCRKQNRNRLSQTDFSDIQNCGNVLHAICTTIYRQPWAFHVRKSTDSAQHFCLKNVFWRQNNTNRKIYIAQHFIPSLKVQFLWLLRKRYASLLSLMLVLDHLRHTQHYVIQTCTSQSAVFAIYRQPFRGNAIQTTQSRPEIEQSNP